MLPAVLPVEEGAGGGVDAGAVGVALHLHLHPVTRRGHRDQLGSWPQEWQERSKRGLGPLTLLSVTSLWQLYITLLKLLPSDHKVSKSENCSFYKVYKFCILMSVHRYSITGGDAHCQLCQWWHGWTLDGDPSGQQCLQLSSETNINTRGKENQDEYKYLHRWLAK